MKYSAKRMCVDVFVETVLVVAYLNTAAASSLSLHRFGSRSLMCAKRDE